MQQWKFEEGMNELEIPRSLNRWGNREKRKTYRINSDRQTERDKNDWHRFVTKINLKDDKGNRQTDRHKDRQTETGKSYDQPMAPKMIKKWKPIQFKMCQLIVTSYEIIQNENSKPKRIIILINHS